MYIQLMGCIHISIIVIKVTIRVMELRYYIYIFNQSVICHARGLEAIRHRGGKSLLRWILPCTFT